MAFDRPLRGEAFWTKIYELEAESKYAWYDLHHMIATFREQKLLPPPCSNKSQVPTYQFDAAQLFRVFLPTVDATAVVAGSEMLRLKATPWNTLATQALHSHFVRSGQSFGLPELQFFVSRASPTTSGAITPELLQLWRACMGVSRNDADVQVQLLLSEELFTEQWQWQLHADTSPTQSFSFASQGFESSCVFAAMATIGSVPRSSWDPCCWPVKARPRDRLPGVPPAYLPVPILNSEGGFTVVARRILWDFDVVVEGADECSVAVSRSVGETAEKRCDEASTFLSCVGRHRALESHGDAVVDAARRSRKCLRGGSTGPTTEDVVLNCVMKEIIRRSCFSALYVPPRRAAGLVAVKRLPPDMATAPRVFFAGFDGPRRGGHFFAIDWNKHTKLLHVADQHPEGKAREVTLAAIRLLKPSQVKYTKLPCRGPGTCADSVVTFFADVTSCELAESLFPLHGKTLSDVARSVERDAVVGKWRCSSCPGRAGLRCSCPRFGAAPCQACKKAVCVCDNAFRRQDERNALLAELQALSGRLVDQSGAYMKSAPKRPDGSYGCLASEEEKLAPTNPLALLLALQTVASVLSSNNMAVAPVVHASARSASDPWELIDNNNLWGGGDADDGTVPENAVPTVSQSRLNDLIAKQQFCDAPALSYEEQKSRLNEGGPPERGEWVRVIRRASTGDDGRITVDTLLRREEIGQIVSVSSTRGVCTVRWEMTPNGFVREFDDDAAFRFHTSSLPVRQAGSHAILFVEKLGKSKPPPRQIGSDSDGDDSESTAVSDDDETDDDVSTATGGSDSSSSDSSSSSGSDADDVGHFSPYAEIDVGEDLQAALWTVYDPHELSGRTHSSESITGKEFLDAKKLSFDSAKARTPSIVWASCAEDTRKKHIAEIARFEEYLKERPSVQHLPLDVLLSHFFQVQLKTRKKDGSDLTWGTMCTLMGTMVGALSAFPIYADTKLAIRPSRWPFFKNMMDAAERMKAKHPPRTIAPATYADVKEARKHLSDAMQVALIVMWFTGSRFSTDVAHLQKKSFRFGDNGDVTVHYTEHKTGKAAGRYTIATKINDPEAMAKVKSFVEALATDTTYLFPLPANKQAGQKERSRLGAQLRNALRQSRKELEIKSMRQGTLQMLAKLKLTDAQILTFTHHTSMTTLKSYLEGEQVLHETQRQAQELAAGLAGGGVLADVSTVIEEEPCHTMFEPLSMASVPLDYWAAVDKHGRISYSALPPDPKRIDRSGYRLHAKPETAEGISWKHVLELSTTSEASKNFLRAQLVWVSNASGAYSAVPWDGKIRHASLTEEQIKMLVDINNIAAVAEDEEHKVAGTIHIFKVPEDSKLRWRVIKHPVDFNSFYGRDTVQQTGNTTRRRARQAILESECCIDMDLAGFFDQLRLDDDASWFQVFCSGGKLFRNLRVPMGGRHSTQIATAVTQVLLDFDTRGVRVDYCTDNVRFAGPRALVSRVAFEFTQRCRAVRARLNEIDVDSVTEAEIAARISYKDADFVGEVANYVDKTICCRKKHVEKLAHIWQVLSTDRATFRDLFALYAMLLYMSETLGIRMDRQYAVRKFFSGLARELALQPKLWGQVTQVRPPPECAKWVRLAIANRPAKLRRAPPPDVVIIGDACAVGYGGLICKKVAGRWKVTMVQQRWTQLENERLRTQHSVASEPEATVRLARKAMQMYGDHVTILYVTDHLSFVHAVGHGSSMRPEYNARVSRFRDLQPFGELLYEEGSKNIADKYSRFLATKLIAADEAAAISLATTLIGERNTGRPCVVECAKVAGERAPASAPAGVSPRSADSLGGAVERRRRVDERRSCDGAGAVRRLS